MNVKWARPFQQVVASTNFKEHWPGLLSLFALLFIYTGSLQWQINGSGSDYAIDSGEMQVALNLWGTIHYTGYPQFTILSAALTGLGKGLGLEPAAAASATSVVWMLSGLALVYAILRRLAVDSLLAAALVLALGLVETVWMHAVIVEVYAFSFLLLAAQVFLALSLADEWRDRTWFGLVLLMGTAVSHHRLLVFALPGLAMVVWRRPSRWEWRFWLKSGVVFLLPFLAYLYLPLRAWGHGRWLYGDPGRWAGFWAQFFAAEVPDFLFVRPQSVADWLANSQTLWAGMTAQAPGIFWLAGLAGLLWLARRHRQQAGALLLVFAALLAFAWVYPRAVWLPATLLLPLLPAAVGVGVLVGELGRKRMWVRAGLLVGLLVGAGGLWRQNMGAVTAVSQDPSSMQLVERLRPLSTGTLAIPWGTDYFAAAYGLYVTGDLSGFTLVDHRADFDAIVATEGQLLTPDYYLGNWPYESWRQRWGSAFLSTAVPGVTAISPQPLHQAIPSGVNFEMGNGVRIRQT
ncbi:MAG: protein O-mannosyl-transferase family, partial [Anaerolineae bacterium]